MKNTVQRKILRFQTADFFNRFRIQIILLLVGVFFFTSFTFAEPGISLLWEKEIEPAGRSIEPYAIKVADDNVVRVVGLSHVPRGKDPMLVEYRLNLNTNSSELKDLLSMDEEDITLLLPGSAVKDARSIDGSMIILRNQYKTHDLQELTIGSDGTVKTRDIPGLTRNSVSTHGACRNLNGDVFLCGNSGYIRKIHSDGNVAWDINYKSDKGEDGTLGVVFSESENLLVAFGMSFEPDTKFTSKDSSLWLANLDAAGEFVTKMEFEGIANFGKFPAFCLDRSDYPVVIYDTSSTLKKYHVVVSKFSKDLKRKKWTTSLFQDEDVMVSNMSLTPFEGNILVTFVCMRQKGIKPYFYVLDKNGNIITQTVMEDLNYVNPLMTISDGRLYFITKAHRHQNDPPTTFLRLLCFQIQLT